MLLSRQQLGAIAFCSADPSRVSLGHLRIDPDGTVYATDEHTLVRVIAKGNPLEDEFPKVNIPLEASSPATSVLLPAGTARAVLGTLKKRKGCFPILSYALFRVHGETLYLATTDLETPQVFTVSVPDSTFPNVVDVLPGGKYGGEVTSDVPIGINADYLGRVAAYRRLFDTPTSVLRVTSRGKTAPVLFEWEDGHGHEVLVLVMPMRL